MTHFVAADVGSARSDADDAEVVVAVARVAVVDRVVVRPLFAVIRVLRVTSKNLTDTK